MTRRRFVAIASCVFGAVAISAAVIWLGSRSDEMLSRWSAIAGVIASVFAVLTFVATLIPLWPHDKNDSNDDTTSDMKAQDPTGTTTITQTVNNSGTANVLGQGTQNVNIYRSEDTQKDRREGQ